MNRIFTVILAAAVLCSCQGNSSILHQKKEKLPVRVKVQTVARSQALCRNSYMGEAVPVRQVTLTAPYPGTLKSLEVCQGSIVGQGEVVAVLSSQQVESSYSIAQANLEQARDAMERARLVYDSGTITEVQLMDIETKLEKAEASMASARRAVEDCSLKAPYRGVVSEVYPSAGEDLAAGAGVMKITDISGFKINIPVHENEIGAIRTGMPALADIPALGIKDAPARVCERGILSSSLTHSYMCSLNMDRIPRGLMPGMAVKVRFESLDSESRIVIPSAAVQIDARGKYVWVSDSCTVAKRHIVPGGYAGKGVIVSEGLKDGDKVIVEGYQKVSTGMKVTEIE